MPAPLQALDPRSKQLHKPDLGKPACSWVGLCGMELRAAEVGQHPALRACRAEQWGLRPCGVMGRLGVNAALSFGWGGGRRGWVPLHKQGPTRSLLFLSHQHGLNHAVVQRSVGSGVSLERRECCKQASWGMTASVAALLLPVFLFSSLNVLFSARFSESPGETIGMGSAVIHAFGARPRHEHVCPLQHIPASLCLCSASREPKGAGSAARGG